MRIVMCVLAVLVASHASADPCGDRATAIRAKLSAPKEDQPRRAAAPKSAKWRPLDGLAVRVEITKDGIYVENSKVDKARIGRALSGYTRMRTDDGRKLPLEIVAEAELPVRAVYDVVSRASLTPRLVVMRETIVDVIAEAKVPAGAAAWVQTWLDDLRKLTEPSKKQEHLKDGIKRAMGTECPQMVTAFGKVGEQNPADIHHYIAKAIPAALEECKCKGVDLGFDFIFTVVNSRAQAFGWLPLGKQAPRDAKTVADLVKTLAAAEQ